MDKADSRNRDSGVVSAQVSVRADAALAADVMGVFARAGFSVGAAPADNFSIAAPPETFERFFGVPLQAARPGGMVPLHALPTDLREKIQSVVLPSVPDFGPNSY